ncbi:MAG: hypothetical protein K2O49_06235, partial [Muribaculaceae bacterium]|nr:hypothetical protein [Muribaculaceae bacterium]
ISIYNYYFYTSKLDNDLNKARNLMDHRDYTYSIYRSLNIINYSYSLRPREFLLSLKYKF